MNGQGQTMVVIPGPVEFDMGSPPSEAGRTPHEQLHRQRIGRTFAVAIKPVTARQFLRFRKNHAYRTDIAPTKDCPANTIDWYQAAAYCNWLSEQEGIRKEQWCFETNRQEVVTKLKERYLSLVGYRLPTEAEWEYACRAGTVTSRFYGETEELLGKYAWYVNNSGGHSWPVGSLKPNDLGLFDMLGNIYVWCQEHYKPYPKSDVSKAIEDTEDSLISNDREYRLMRGSSSNFPAVNMRCANRTWNVPTTAGSSIGFRVARTLTAE
jgi:formylglycine-generating enzyme required for sulfatase activity